MNWPFPEWMKPHDWDARPEWTQADGVSGVFFFLAVIVAVAVTFVLMEVVPWLRPRVQRIRARVAMSRGLPAIMRHGTPREGGRGIT